VVRGREAASCVYIMCTYATTVRADGWHFRWALNPTKMHCVLVCNFVVLFSLRCLFTRRIHWIHTHTHTHSLALKSCRPDFPSYRILFTSMSFVDFESLSINSLPCLSSDTLHRHLNIVVEMIKQNTIYYLQQRCKYIHCAHHTQTRVSATIAKICHVLISV